MSNDDSEARDALAGLVRIFMDAAMRQVEQEIEAEEKAGEPVSGHDKLDDQLKGQ